MKTVEINEKIAEEIVRKTKSICHFCMDTIPARIVVRKGAVYLKKICPVHGESELLLSAYPSDYKRLNEFYFSVIPQNMIAEEYYLCVTTECNIGCPICFLRKCMDRGKPLSPAKIKELVKDRRIKRITLSHGEPTVSHEIFDAIHILKKSGKIINIHTNGIKLSDFDYASRLALIGLDHVSLQFDGFSKEVYGRLRGNENLLDYKLRALDNLRKLSIPVTLNVTIAKGINEDEVGHIFDYAVKERFLKDVSFITYCRYDSDPSAERCHHRASERHEAGYQAHESRGD